MIASVIRSFRCFETLAVFQGKRSRRFASIRAVLERKLIMLDSAVRLDDLRSPPGNRLEALRGNRADQYSIRVNDQFRICFRWTDAGVDDVEVVDYH
jgi:proteic killer suppression protein